MTMLKAQNGERILEVESWYEYRLVKEFTDKLRERGTKKFAFTNTGTDAIPYAWAFTQNGCTLDGIAELEDSVGNRKPALLFSVN